MAAKYANILLSVAAVLFGRVVLCAPLCLAGGDFDSQLQQILRAQMLSAQDPIIIQVLDDVRTTLNQRWPGYELSLVGSLATGLSTIASDVDLTIQIPNFNSSAGLYVLEETATLFNKQPELYSQVSYKHNEGYICSYFRCYHIPSQRTVEIEFDTADISIQNSKLIRYYFQLDDRFRHLGVFLKYWSSVHHVTGHGEGRLLGYALYLLIIFYLQQKHMVPPAYQLQVKARTHYFDGWNMAFNELPYSTTNTENLYQLLGGFFKYYSEFNFEEYIVSPFAGRPIPRNAFTDVNNFPTEYLLHTNTLNRTMQLAIKNDLDTEVSIQDAFTLDLNAAELLSHEHSTKLKCLMKSMATMFDELSSDRILGAILSADDHNSSELNRNNATKDGTNYQNFIEPTDTHVVLT